MLKNIQQMAVTKKVTYFGTKLIVPRNTAYLAAHRNGHINAYASRPYYGADDWHWWEGSLLCTVAVVDIDTADVQGSLVCVESP